MKISTAPFISARKPSSASSGDTCASASRMITSSAAPPDSSAHSPVQIAAMTNVTAGPATAMLNSAPGESVSRLIFAMPPKNHRSIPLISMPRRRATSAWPSSCRTIDTKNSSTAMTATTYACVEDPPTITLSKKFDSSRIRIPRTMNQLGLAPMRMPNSRPIWIEPPPPPNMRHIVAATVDGGRCATAHRVAKAWMTAFRRTSPRWVARRAGRKLRGLFAREERGIAWASTSTTSRRRS